MTSQHLRDPLQALVFVRLGDPSPVRFERFLGGAAGIVAAWHIVGDVDLAVQVRCPDLAALDRLLTAMRTGGAVATSTHLVVRQASLTSVSFQEPAVRRTRTVRRAVR
ncbi:Lrp/AsnC ligand binding domain-containing protein [Dactylosporangium sp. NBC_01737]|uniref:Lrp/AsnC ligand binding domain-containing protein n=1 Tax=Dactylosporangium sp. NBC_01737 TaxID=2975959 RepID=UPI002E0D4C86|nr:Lrp/AsnC ligand binding domain-containing protein [Dactylosporangium sp. NBC_01737]